MSKPHLSHSQVSMLTRCGYQYMFRYVRGIKSPPGVALIVGKGTHKSVEANLGAKISGEAIALDAAKEIAASAVTEDWAQEAPALTEDDGSPEKAKGAAVDKAVRLATLHHTMVAPAITPAAVEQSFRIEADEWAFDILGYKDVVEVDGTVRDTKTTGKSPPSDAALVSDQGAIYSWDSELSGKPAPKFALDYLVDTKTPKALTLEATFDAQDFGRVAKRYEAAWAAIQAGAFLPAPRDAWVCSPRWCGYWAQCPHGARNTTVVPVSRLARHAGTAAATDDTIDW